VKSTSLPRLNGSRSRLLPGFRFRTLFSRQTKKFVVVWCLVCVCGRCVVYNVCDLLELQKANKLDGFNSKLCLSEREEALAP